MSYLDGTTRTELHVPDWPAWTAAPERDTWLTELPGKIHRVFCYVALDDQDRPDETYGVVLLEQYNEEKPIRARWQTVHVWYTESGADMDDARALMEQIKTRLPAYLTEIVL